MARDVQLAESRMNNATRIPKTIQTTRRKFSPSLVAGNAHAFAIQLIEMACVLYLPV
jgi:hypothetical protein